MDSTTALPYYIHTLLIDRCCRGCRVYLKSTFLCAAFALNHPLTGGAHSRLSKWFRLCCPFLRLPSRCDSLYSTLLPLLLFQRNRHRIRKFKSLSQRDLIPTSFTLALVNQPFGTLSDGSPVTGQPASQSTIRPRSNRFIAFSPLLVLPGPSNDLTTTSRFFRKSIWGHFCTPMNFKGNMNYSAAKQMSSWSGPEPGLNLGLTKTQRQRTERYANILGRSFPSSLLHLITDDTNES